MSSYLNWGIFLFQELRVGHHVNKLFSLTCVSLRLFDAINTSWLFQIEPGMLVCTYNPSTYKARGWRVPAWPELETLRSTEVLWKPVIVYNDNPSLERPRQDCELEASLCYRVNSRPAWPTE